MSVAWVIGRGGLLGLACARTLAAAGWTVLQQPSPYRWSDRTALAAQFAADAEALAAVAGSVHPIQLWWTAGVGTMGSAPAELAAETEALHALLDVVVQHESLMRRPCTIVFASSAGALHSGRHPQAITEHTEVSPVSAYGHEKLRQEQLLGRFAERHPGLNVLCARLSSLYGPAPRPEKRQGLLTHIARSIVRRRPVHIYVPLDTVRDYLHVDDAARAMLAAACLQPAATGLRVKLVASQQATTVAEVVAMFRRASHSPPRIVTSASRESGLYDRAIRFRSVVPPLEAAHRCRGLSEGIAQVLAFERARFAREGA